MGFKLSTGSRTGAITFIQLFGGSLNLNIHFHTLCLDGAYSFADGKAQFHFNKAPSQEELEKLLKQIATRIVRHLEKRGLIEKDEEGAEDKALTPAQQSSRMTWAQRLKRVFNLDLESRAPTPWPPRGPPAATTIHDPYTQKFPNVEF